jgi:hypothetical protein
MYACECSWLAGTDKLTTSLSLRCWRGQIRSATQEHGEIPGPSDDLRLEGQHRVGARL